MDIISQCSLITVIGLSFYEIDLDSIPNSNKNIMNDHKELFSMWTLGPGRYDIAKSNITFHF